MDAIGIMSLGAIIDLDRQIAVHAVQISTELKLAMADSIILATRQASDVILWTPDEHFKGLDKVRYKEKKTKIDPNLIYCFAIFQILIIKSHHNRF